jgi:hypothetical protein
MSMLLAMLLVRAAYPCCMSLLLTNAARPYLVHAARTCSSFMHSNCFWFFFIEIFSDALAE